MSMQTIGLRFSDYSSKLPQFVIQDTFVLALKKDLTSLQSIFDGDISRIRTLINQNNFTGIKNWKKFDDATYLFENTLYTRGHPPKGTQETIAWIANLYIAKHVLERLINYVISRIGVIRFALEKFVREHGRDLYMIMSEYIGCCDNIVNVANEYATYMNQIVSNITGVRGVTNFLHPKRENIRMGINDCLLKTKYGKEVIYPSVRTYTEFPIRENVKIIIMQKLNGKRKRNKIKEIYFKSAYSTDDMFSLFKKLCTVNTEQIKILRSIYNWGSGAVHIGQHVPLSLIWYSLIWLQENMHLISAKRPKLRYNDVREIYDELKNNCKITEYSNVDYVNSIYDCIILPEHIV